ncbi:calcium uniporter protein 2, mitochondrial-like [Phragmites australis]|uniref:calcium uniporter protein 2, mitochondrial-like n=1 Tax=Phragmites australis TaxID=29695 RepID=UPI002D787354|nr:calcium uniporter protein 2, mitochondrial-like [Phragmites australis]
MAAVLRRAVAQPCAASSLPVYGLRRFLQEQPAFRPAVPPDRFMPLADRIRDLGVGFAYPRINLDGLVPPDRFMPLADRIRNLGVGFAFPRINLDGLVPPASPPATAAPAPAASLTVEEARKVLRATQMEAARARLRASGAAAVPYAEYLRLCCDAAGADVGPSVARALDESGSVIVLGKTVFLRPEMVVKAIEKAIPVQQTVPVAENDPAREELKAMEAQKVDIDRAAASQVRRELWCGLAYLVVQTAGFMRLTFWELSWDVMEPICFYVTSMYFMAGYAFFLRTKKEPSFEGFFESRFAAKQKRLMQARDFDLRRYDELRRACGLLPALRAQSPCATSPSQESGFCRSYCHCH